MTEWAARRFWDAAAVVRDGDGWSVCLDDRPIRTPTMRPLVMPTEAMARALAAEWDAQGEVIVPASMPVTRAANTAVDKVAEHLAEVTDALAAYGETDLLCYRADSPDALMLRQAAGWDPLLGWAEATLGARLVSVAGVMPQSQDAHALERLRGEVSAMDEFTLTGFHDLVTLSGSLVLGLVVERGRLSAETAWGVSRIDEEFQADLWGHDAEADTAAAIRRDAFLAAARFVTLSRRNLPRP